MAPTTTTVPGTTATTSDDHGRDEHPDNFGAMVSEDARDGGVDGHEISEAAHERNEKRQAARPGPQQINGPPAPAAFAQIVQGHQPQAQHHHRKSRAIVEPPFPRSAQNASGRGRADPRPAHPTQARGR